MPTRTVAHALARWAGTDGTPRLASHGQTIDVDEDTAAALDAIGATTPATEEIPQLPGEETREDKRARITAALKADPHLSNRRHAEEIGVDHKTVGSIRKTLEEAGEIPHPDNIVSPPAPADGPRRPRPTATQEKWAAYAKARGIPANEVDAMPNKDAIIAATNELDERENTNV